VAQVTCATSGVFRVPQVVCLVFHLTLLCHVWCANSLPCGVCQSRGLSPSLERSSSKSVDIPTSVSVSLALSMSLSLLLCLLNLRLSGSGSV